MSKWLVKSDFSKKKENLRNGIIDQCRKLVFLSINGYPIRISARLKILKTIESSRIGWIKIEVGFYQIKKSAEKWKSFQFSCRAEVKQNNFSNFQKKNFNFSDVKRQNFQHQKAIKILRILISSNCNLNCRSSSGQPAVAHLCSNASQPGELSVQRSRVGTILKDYLRSSSEWCQPSL